LQVYIEYRFYGKSVPFVSSKDALKNATLRGYFNSAQALADYARFSYTSRKIYRTKCLPLWLLEHLMEESYSFVGLLSTMLAAWFRLKYRHIALGAVASSAPILYFDNITPSNAYYDLVTKDFRAEIDKVAAGKNGLAFLSIKFKTCNKNLDLGLYTAFALPYIVYWCLELKDYLEYMYTGAAQYDDPQESPVNKACNAIDGALEDTDALDWIISGIVDLRGEDSCHDTCSAMVSPIGIGKNDTMSQADPFNLTEYMDSCNKSYGVDIRVVLKRFGSNIIFSNGLRDPYSSEG
ncbi:hypothetical protein CICLE_v10033480mg, partial [Citrus x clementina]